MTVKFSASATQALWVNGGQPLNEPIVGMASTADGRGYREVARDGGIFSFGDAQSTAPWVAKSLNAPIVGIAATSGRERLLGGGQ